MLDAKYKEFNIYVVYSLKNKINNHYKREREME